MLKLTFKAPSTTSNTTSNDTTGTKLRINLTNSAIQSTPPAPLPPAAIEEHFLLRLPPSLASLLTSSLVENDFTHPGDLEIRFVSPRTALVSHPRFIKPGYAAVLCDLPACLETLKNPSLQLDYTQRKVAGDEEDGEGESSLKESYTVGQYYKVADLNQVLVVLDLDLPGEEPTKSVLARLPQHIINRLGKLHAAAPDSFNAIRASITASELAAERPQSTCEWAQLPDGLTPPLKSAYKRRFAPRPLPAAKCGVIEDIEAQLERLIKADGQAIESSFTLYGPDGEVLLGVGANGVGEDLDDFAAEIEDNLMQDLEEVEGEDDHGLEEGDEGEGDETMGEEIMDNVQDVERDAFEDDNLMEPVEDTEMSQQSSQLPPSQPSQPQSSQPSQDSRDSMIRELQEKLQEKQRQAASVTNPLIKARIEDVIRQLEDNLRHLGEQ